MRRTGFFGLRGTQVSLALAVLAAPAVSGCGSSDALKKQISSLETQLTSVRADQDRLEERLAALEIAQSEPSRPSKRASQPPPVEHPRLKVIHLSPDQTGPAVDPAGAAGSEGADSNGRRPAIRGTGDKIIKTGDADDASTQTIQNGAAKSPPVAQLGGTRGN